MAALPLHPRLAHLLVAVHRDDRPLAVDVAALLGERDPLRGAGAPSDAAAGADIDLRLAALRASRAGGARLSPAARRALQRIDRVARQLSRLCSDDDGLLPAGLDAGLCLALAYPDRLAQRAGGYGRRYRLRSGRAVRLRADDPLQGSDWLVVADLDAQARDGTVWLAAALSAADVMAVFGDEIACARELRWDPDLGDVVARECRRLDSLVIDERPVPLQADDAVAGMLCEQVRERGLGLVGGDADELRARIALVRRYDPSGGWPDLGDAALREDVEGWLMPWLRPGEGAAQLRRLRLEDVLAGLLDWPRRRRLDTLLPTHVETPAGTRRRVRYANDGPPTLAVPLQEMLGLSTGPVLLDGRLPLVLQLLSPAGRPLQVTSDLAGFWQGAYDEVRKEMRGRYPKHHWPDDPAHAQATRFTRRRKPG
jgi:ATP-dependent helicase HrpB